MTNSAARKWTKRKLGAIGSDSDTPQRYQYPIICGLEFNIAIITCAQDSGWILPLLGSQGCWWRWVSKRPSFLGRIEEIDGNPQSPIAVGMMVSSY